LVGETVDEIHSICTPHLRDAAVHQRSWMLL